jgi:hypothetical protein
MVIALGAVRLQWFRELMGATRPAQHRMAHHRQAIGRIRLVNLVLPEA